MHQPTSWARLDAIEAWLAGGAARQDPERVPQAELELAEGRIRLTREEAGSLPSTTLAVRLTAAEAGFRRVLDDPLASTQERVRARHGLEELSGMRVPGRYSAGDARGIVVRPRSEWRARNPNTSRLTPHTGSYERITVHHSARHTGEMGNRSLSNVYETIQKIQLVQMRDRNWGDIGYHYVIDPEGRVFSGRSLRYQGAHSGGNNNKGNIGICLLGNFNEERPSARAMESLEALLVALRQRHGIARGALYGHQEFMATECPGNNLMPWVQNYRGSRPRTARQGSASASTNPAPTRRTQPALDQAKSRTPRPNAVQ